MTTFQFDGEVALGPDDELFIGDDILRGNVVYFDRVDDHKVVMRTLTEGDLASFPGRAYRSERGDPGCALRLTQLR